MTQITPYILAGGKSRRMKSDKRLLKFGSETMLQRICRIAFDAAGVSPILVGDNLADISTGDYKVITDFRSGSGPIGGLISALRHSRSDWVLVLGGDMPFLLKEDISQLIDAVDDRYDVITLSLDGKPEPLVALYHRRTLGFWETRIDRSELSLRDSIRLLNWCSVSLASDNMSLFNINYPRDFHAAVLGRQS